MRRAKRGHWLGMLLGALLVAGAVVPAAAASGGERALTTVLEPVGNKDLRITTEAAAYVEDPAVAWNSADDQFLVVWSDRRNYVLRDYDIYGKIVAADGTKVTGDFRISDNASKMGDTWPAVAYNPDRNEYLVVWSDSRTPARSNDTYGRRVAADGSLPEAGFRICGPAATGGEGAPAVAYDTANKSYLVVWPDGRDPNRGLDIYGRLVPGAGVPTAADFRISGDAAVKHEGYPDVAFNAAADGYLVVWRDDRSYVSGRGLEIYGRRVSAAGAPLGTGDTRLSDSTGGENMPAVAADPVADRYLVVWDDDRSAARGRDIYGQWVSGSGAQVGGDFRITGGGGSSNQSYPDAAYHSGRGEFLVVWQDGRDLEERMTDVYGRHVTGAGPTGSDVRLCSRAAVHYETWTAVAFGATGAQYLVVWEDDRLVPGTQDHDVFGRFAEVVD